LNQKQIRMRLIDDYDASGQIFILNETTLKWCCCWW